TPTPAGTLSLARNLTNGVAVNGDDVTTTAAPATAVTGTDTEPAAAVPRPRTLDLLAGRVASEHTLRFGLGCRYVLSAVVVHHGGAGSGHFTTFRRFDRFKKTIGERGRTQKARLNGYIAEENGVDEKRSASGKRERE